MNNNKLYHAGSGNCLGKGGGGGGGAGLASCNRTLAALALTMSWPELYDSHEVVTCGPGQPNPCLLAEAAEPFWCFLSSIYESLCFDAFHMVFALDVKIKRPTSMPVT